MRGSFIPTAAMKNPTYDLEKRYRGHRVHESGEWLKVTTSDAEWATSEEGQSQTKIIFLVKYPAPRPRTTLPLLRELREFRVFPDSPPFFSKKVLISKYFHLRVGERRGSQERSAGPKELKRHVGQEAQSSDSTNRHQIPLMTPSFCHPTSSR